MVYMVKNIKIYNNITKKSYMPAYAILLKF